MFTTAGYSESQDSATLIEAATLADTSLRVIGDDLYVPKGLNNLMGVYIAGVNFTQARLDSPSLREMWPEDIEPADVSAEPGSPANFYDLFDNPVPLVETEFLRALMAEDGTGATRVTILVWLGDGAIDAIAGPIRTIRATGTITLVAFAWTAVPLTFAQTLPAGRYGIAGLRAQAAGLIAARIFVPGSNRRPGVVGFDADGDLDVPRFRYGRAGLFDEFDHDNPPQVECLSASADTAETFHLDLVKLG